MGVLLTTRSCALTRRDDPFLVVSEDLRLVAVSESAEKMFGVEASLLSHPLLAVLSSPTDEKTLPGAVRRAATGSREVVTLPAQIASRAMCDAGPLEARITTCGPPRAALVVTMQEPRQG